MGNEFPFTFETPTGPIEAQEELDIQIIIGNQLMDVRIQLQGVLAPTRPDIFHFLGIMNGKNIIHGFLDTTQRCGLITLENDASLKEDQFLEAIFTHNRVNDCISISTKSTVVCNEATARQLADSIKVHVLKTKAVIFSHPDPDTKVIASTLWAQDQQTRQYVGSTVRGENIKTLVIN